MTDKDMVRRILGADRRIALREFDAGDVIEVRRILRASESLEDKLKAIVEAELGVEA